MCWSAWKWSRDGADVYGGIWVNRDVCVRWENHGVAKGLKGG